MFFWICVMHPSKNANVTYIYLNWDTLKSLNSWSLLLETCYSELAHSPFTSLVPRPFHLHGSGEKAWHTLQCACVITQRIRWIHYTLVFFHYMLCWRELRHCSLVEDGQKCVLQCHWVRVFCACLLSFNTYMYKENYCRLLRLCTKGRTCLCDYWQGLGTAICIGYQILLFLSEKGMAEVTLI